MKNILFFLILAFIVNSCSKKFHPEYKSILEIDATIINKRTNNYKFIPKESYEPLYVRVNYILLLDENGEGNFDGKNEEDNYMLDQIFIKSNELYAKLIDVKDSVCYKGTDFIENTKIQLQFKKMHIRDSFARNYLNTKGYTEVRRKIGMLNPSNRWYLKYLDNAINDTISKKGINVYNTINDQVYKELIYDKSSKGYLSTKAPAVSQFPSYTNFTQSSQIHFPNKYTSRLWMENFYAIENNKSWEKYVKGYFISNYRGLSHELGHSLGLAHSNEYHGTNKCFKAMMSQSGKSPRNYIQPSEIGKMHKALMTSNLIQYVTEESNYNSPLIISENENWDFKTIRFYQNIIVKENKVLILNGNIILPEKASITLEKNALLILNKTSIKTSNNKTFTNYIKKKHAQIIEY